MLPVAAITIVSGVVTWLGSLVSSIVAIVSSAMVFLASRFGIVVAMRIALGLAFLAILGVLIVGINAIITNVIPVLPQDLVPITYCIPSNFSLCAGSIISVKLLIWAWSWKRWYFELLTAMQGA